MSRYYLGREGRQTCTAVSRSRISVILNSDGVGIAGRIPIWRADFKIPGIPI